MKPVNIVPVERLRELFNYNPETGLLTRKVCQQYQAAGKIAGRRGDAQGHLVCDIDGTRIYVHRIAWAMHYGTWPEKQIDHINRIPDDNRIENLRLVSNAENQQNRAVQANNQIGVAGVSKAGDKWRVRIVVNGKEKSLGRYENLADAIEARRIGVSKLHPFGPSITPSPYPELTPTGAALTYVVKPKSRVSFDVAVQATAMRLKGVSGAEIARRLGCSHNYANEVLKGRCNPRAFEAAKQLVAVSAG